MVKIIGHRGAAGLALENSIEGIKEALKLNVDGIEFDVRRTKDDKLVVLHNTHTGKMSDAVLRANDSTLDELRAIATHNDARLATPAEILQLIGANKPIVIDIKDADIAPQLIRLANDFPQCDISFTGRQRGVMLKIREALPQVPFFIQSHLDPFEVVQAARSLRATGISLNMWLINPVTYYQARRAGLEVRLYTVDHPLIMRFIKIFYPDVTIYTNHPERFI